MREAGEKNSQPIERATSQCNNAPSFTVQPQSTKERSTTQHENADRKGQCFFLDAPSELLCQWHSENAPGVNSAERDLDEDSRDRDYLTIIRAHRLIILELSTASLFVSHRDSLCRYARHNW